MLRIYFILIVLLIVAMSISCQKGQNSPPPAGNGQTYSTWLVDTNELSGTAIRDVFPVIINPDYLPVDEMDFMQPQWPVIALKLGGQVFVYPHVSMSVEVVNDQFAGTFFAVTWCPITGSSMVWNRLIGSDTLSFAASGILFRENLVPYDLETRSLWSQMKVQGIHGKFAGIDPEILPSIETTWETITEYYPDALVFEDVFGPSLKIATGLDYQIGERVFGVIMPRSVLTISADSIAEEPLMQTIVTRAGSQILITSKSERVVALYRDPINLSFVAVDSFPVVMRDQNGLHYDIFGSAVSSGFQLEVAKQYIAKWWAWQDFYGDFNTLN